MIDKSTPKLNELYKEIILEHYSNPCGREPLERIDMEAEGMNPLCGDEVNLKVQLENNKVKKVHIEGHGCSISVASGSILADLLKEKSLEEVKKYLNYVKEMMHDNRMGLYDSIKNEIDIGDLEVLEGIKKFPVRIKCALLPWTTLEEAMAGHKHVEIS